LIKTNIAPEKLRKTVSLAFLTLTNPLSQLRAKDYVEYQERNEACITAIWFFHMATKLICKGFGGSSKANLMGHTLCKQAYEEPQVAEGFRRTEGPIKTDKTKSIAYEDSKDREWKNRWSDDTEKDQGTDPDKDGVNLELGESLVKAVSEAQSAKEALVKLYESVGPVGRSKINSGYAEMMSTLGEDSSAPKETRGKAKIAVIKVAVKVKKIIVKEWKEDIRSWSELTVPFLRKNSVIAAELEQQQKTQRELMKEQSETRQRIVAVANHSDWFEERRSEALGARQLEVLRCASMKERIRLKYHQISAMRKKLVEIKATISLEPPQKPICKGGCSGILQGVCQPKPDPQRLRTLAAIPGVCVCSQEYYGDRCEKKLCPGKYGGMFTSEMNDVCHGGTCEERTGRCIKCPRNQRSGLLGSCEIFACENNCNGSGDCDSKTGKCSCKMGYGGDSCAEKSCPGMMPGKLYNMKSHHACSGRGKCDPSTGMCKCQDETAGLGCEKEGCLKQCSGHGTCDTHKGKCKCSGKFSGEACETIRCPRGNCNGHGTCDNMTGRCSACAPGFVGDACLPATTCETVESNWWTTFDKAGWSTCPKGSHITALYRRECAALSCLESAKCSKPCAGHKPLAKKPQAELCYHAGWHDSFDKTGWNKCDKGYFLSGFYRSDEDSLYGLQLAKCCMISGGSWGKCMDTDWSVSFKTEGWSSAPVNQFLTGIYRSDQQNLDGITKVRSCQHSMDDFYKNN